MNKLKLLSLFLFTTLIAGLLVACVPASATTSTPATTDTPTGPPDKVEILYFHRTAR